MECNTRVITNTAHLNSVSIRQKLLHGCRRWWAIQWLRLRIAQERRTLAGLELRELIDMGIDPMRAKQEYQKSFSDIPNSRIPVEFR